MSCRCIRLNFEISLNRPKRTSKIHMGYYKLIKFQTYYATSISYFINLSGVMLLKFHQNTHLEFVFHKKGWNIYYISKGSFDAIQDTA